MGRILTRVEGHRIMTELVHVQVRGRDIGRIIGRGGSTIKMLTSSFHVDIDIPKDSKGDTVPVKIEGSSGGVQACIQKMAQILGYIPQQDGATAPPAAEKKDLSAEVIREALFFPDPSGRAFDTFMTYLRSATTSIDICIYTLSHQDIADYLVVAHKAGIRVRIVCDNDTVHNRGADFVMLARAGIPVHMDGELNDRQPEEHGTTSLMHHKYCLLDRRVLANGSFNFTKTAESLNSENIMITNDPFFCQSFQQHFDAVFDYFRQFPLKG